MRLGHQHLPFRFERAVRGGSALLKAGVAADALAALLAFHRRDGGIPSFKI
jgi:hypothetical protein